MIFEYFLFFSPYVVPCVFDKTGPKYLFSKRRRFKDIRYRYHGTRVLVLYPAAGMTYFFFYSLFFHTRHTIGNLILNQTAVFAYPALVITIPLPSTSTVLARACLARAALNTPLSALPTRRLSACCASIVADVLELAPLPP